MIQLLSNQTESSPLDLPQSKTFSTLSARSSREHVQQIHENALEHRPGNGSITPGLALSRCERLSDLTSAVDKSFC